MAYHYNANGDLAYQVSGADTTYFDYDEFGNLLRVDQPDGSVLEYVVDGQHRRVGKKVNGVMTTGFLYQNQLNPIAELDGAGNVVSRFVYGANATTPEYMIRGGVTYRIASDHLGSPRLVVNASTGMVVQSVEYDEFGNVLSDNNPGFQPFGFAGGIRDAAIGLIRFGARDYDPKIGRWTTKDPIRFEGRATNLYEYVGNDPVNLRDPSGLTVYFCSRPADLPWPFSEFDHNWIKTDTYEAGMGEVPGEIPGQGNSAWPYVPTQTIDHTGQSKADNTTCSEVPDVNEGCVNSKIAPGQPTGSWMPLNTCQDISIRVLMGCRE